MDSAVKIYTATIIYVSEYSLNKLGHKGNIYICAAYITSFSGICDNSSLRYSKKSLSNKVESLGKIKFMRTFNFGHV